MWTRQFGITSFQKAGIFSIRIGVNVALLLHFAIRRMSKRRCLSETPADLYPETRGQRVDSCHESFLETSGKRSLASLMMIRVRDSWKIGASIRFGTTKLEAQHIRCEARCTQGVSRAIILASLCKPKSTGKVANYRVHDRSISILAKSHKLVKLLLILHYLGQKEKHISQLTRLANKDAT